LCASVAFVWLATGLGVLHPYYRQVGGEYLAPLGLPDWVMVATCVGEILLGLRVALGRPGTWVTALQFALVVGFTAILACTAPALLVSPFGMLTKNLPLLAVLGTAWLVDREGWTPRAVWLLRGGMAVIWITEGVLPKLLFQQPVELDMVARMGVFPAAPSVVLYVVGACQAASGVAALLLRGRPLRLLLAAQAAALVVLPLVAGFLDPLLWVHPFGPLTKNVPILVGTVVLLRRVAR
jgi:hypothetical protein